jgi:hypothetical protein
MPFVRRLFVSDRGDQFLSSFGFHNALPHIEILDLGQVGMLAQALRIFLGKEHLVKNRLIATLDKVINYFKGKNFLWSTKPLFPSQNRVETRDRYYDFSLKHLAKKWEFLSQNKAKFEKIDHNIGI